MKYKNRAAAPEHLKTKTELQQLRLKLAKGQQSAGQYWQGHTYVTLYDPAEAVAMRPHKPASEKQLAVLAAGRALVGTVLCQNCGERVDELADRYRCYDCLYKAELAEQREEMQATCVEAKHWMAQSPLFLDTETTGVDDDAEIVEIALLDANGLVLAEYLVRPSAPVPPEAVAIHGITDDDLADAPAWPEVAAHINTLLEGRLVIAHNADFDARLVKQTNARYQLVQPVFETACTMQTLTFFNGGRWPKLRPAALLVNAEIPAGQQHRARHDAEICRQIVLALARD